MFLSHKQIIEHAEEFFPEREDFDPELVKEACYDLRVGNEVFLSEEKFPRKLGLNEPYVVLAPGQFALIKTYEKIYIPKNYIAFISIKFKLKCQGLVNISGFHVDPTYKGYLIFSVQNVGPNDILLRYMDPAFMIIWANLEPPYEGDPRPPGYERITLDQMNLLGAPGFTLATLKKQVETHALQLKIYGALTVAAFIAVLAVALTVLLGK